MKAKITELTHQELGDILSFVNAEGYFALDYDREAWSQLPCKTEDPCFEDKLADMLLAGESITITDCDAEGDVYADGKLDEDENGVYTLRLDDFLEWGDPHLAYEILEGDGDAWTAHMFIQKVMFHGEVIYG